MATRRGAALALAAILLIFPVYALDDIQGVNVVWNEFVAALRRGDYARAHGLFSPRSRTALPYAEFVAEYGPLSAAREMVLAKPDSLATSVDGDWAEISFGGVNPGTGRAFKVGVALVREETGWGLVAARNETVERMEAGARDLLRLLWQNREHGKPLDLLNALTTAQAGNPVLRVYRLETDGTRFRAFPRDKTLRTFYVDASSGEVTAMERPAPPPPARTPPPARAEETPAAAPSPADVPAAPGNGMPELSDPGMPYSGAYAGPGDDWPEPPMPGAGGGEPSRFAPSLPDQIR